MKLSLVFLFVFILNSNLNGQTQDKLLQLSDSKSFTWIVLPDPQTYTKYGRNQALFDLMIKWIKDQKDKLNIRMVFCEGDLVEQNNIPKADSINGDQTSYEQWQSVSNAFGQLNGLLPYILCTGNHDYNYGTRSTNDRYSQFNSYFPPQRNPLNRQLLVETALNVQGVHSLENACYDWNSPFGQSFLVFSLEFAPSSEVLSWVKEVVKRPQYQHHIGVILTHSYLNSAGERIVYENYYMGGANYGETIWKELVQPSPNIQFVFCGHIMDNPTRRGQIGYRKDINHAGKNVHQILFNAQGEGGGWKQGNGGDGWLRILEFLPDQKTLKVSTFSPLFYISPSTRHLSWRQESIDQFDLSY